MVDIRENLNYWNGQKNLFSDEEFENLAVDKDDEGNSWEATYTLNGIDIKKQSD